MKRNTQLITSLVCFALCGLSARSATYYWDINGDGAGAGGATPSGTWDTGVTANWSTDSAGGVATTTWTDNDDAIFSAGSDAIGTFTVELSGSPTVGDLTVEEGTVTISGGTALNIGGGVASKGVIDVFEFSTLTISSVITGGDDSGTITRGLDGGTGYGTLILTGTNTYTGKTAVRVGTLSFDSIGDVNAGPSALGNPANATLGTIELGSSFAEATLQYTGTGHNSDRVINLPGGEGLVTLDASGSGPLVFTSASGITVTGNGQHSLQLTNAPASEGTITGTIVDGLNFTKVSKWGEGTWTLLGDNSFSGVFDIRFGRIIANSLADQGSNSSIGTGAEGTQHAIIGFGGNTGNNSSNATVRYIGSGHSSNRRMRMYGVSGTTGGATIDASGTGPLVLSGDLLRPASSQNDYAEKTLTLKGDNTDDNAFNGLIADWNFGGPIGKTFVTKDGPGKWLLGGADTYTGATTVKDGTLLVNGTLAAGSTVSVNSGAMLGGSGNINGPVTVAAGGTLSPGASVGTLALGGDLTLSGDLLIEVDKSLTPSNDVITVVGVLTNAGTGTVTVTNLNGGLPLTQGDSFQLFNKAVLNGEALTIVSSGGEIWINNLAVDGSIQVMPTTPPAVPATNLTISAVSPGNVSLGGKGAPDSAYDVYAATNVMTPMTNWWLIGTTNSNGSGAIQFFDSQATNEQRFYRFGQPVP